jgi:SAM-dependent methyltransferase
MDFPQALETARRDALETGLAGRLAFLPGDFMEHSFPPGQDVVLLFNIIHGFSREANRSLVRKALDALRPGGRLYILDQFTALQKGSRVARFIPLMVGLNLLSEIGGTSYGIDDVKEWCGPGAAVRRKRVGLPGVGLVEVVAGGYA